jgi:hypothetical protein
MEFFSLYKPLIILAVLAFCPGMICSLGVLLGGNIGDNIAFLGACLYPICVLTGIWYAIRHFG